MYSFDSPRMAGPDLAAGGPPSRCATTKDAFVPGSAHDDGVYGFVITDGIMIWKQLPLGSHIGEHAAPTLQNKTKQNELESKNHIYIYIYIYMYLFYLLGLSESIF